MKDQPNATLTNEQFSLLIQLIDLGVKTAGLQCINAETNGAIQAFATLKPEQLEPEEKNTDG
tara:strand:+ start:497 stop:682 length:186 start_codon:yes stop_codon:yes gene_type:complete